MSIDPVHPRMALQADDFAAIGQHIYTNGHADQLSTRLRDAWRVWAKRLLMG